MEEILVFFSRLHFSSSTDVDDIDTLKYSAEKEEPYKLKSVRREENTIEAYSDHVTIQIYKNEDDTVYNFSLKRKKIHISGYISLNDDQSLCTFTVGIW